MEGKYEVSGSKTQTKDLEYCCSEHKDLIKLLEEKEKIIKKYETKVKKIYKDFNYNIELIYERDREINILNSRIDELITINREKDMEIVSLQSLNSKVKQLEHEKYLLNKRLENLLSTEHYSNGRYRKPVSLKIEDHGLVNEYKNSTHKKHPSATTNINYLERHSYSSFTNELNRKREDNSTAPLAKLNSDIEKRIKALEHDDNKNESRCNTESSHNEYDILMTKEKLSVKEKEINAIIKSLSPNKRDSVYGKKVDISLGYLIKDQERMKTEPKCNLRIGLMTEVDDKSERISYEPMIRCASAVDKRMIS
ncbi:hypothetical protein SteCoe_35589 [Stentor coeruleus]|uniref:Uncharacterized protein n=1 Tax=Stentor coeruleus TaxID=5963 RepID=A0A1R2ARY0_9CILI|nr:hypothetical protein SteCoe_35589 [Stentor coeruleus]